MVTANNSICDIPTKNEIRNVVFSLNKDACAEPDGFSAHFYQTTWNIMKDDIVEAAIDYFNGSCIPRGFSHTSIALIPKVVLADSWSKFRPISLCSCFHKILSKKSNDWLTLILSDLISDNQSGFLPSRSIVDNILLTQEMSSSIDHKIRGSNLILKLDLLKAYDRVLVIF